MGTRFYDYNDNLVNPATQRIIIYDSNRLARGTYTHLTMWPGSIGLGTWSHDYAVPANAPTGDWLISWRATYLVGGGTYPIRERINFKVGV